jgi:hypothetical protein
MALHNLVPVKQVSPQLNSSLLAMHLRFINYKIQVGNV